MKKITILALALLLVPVFATNVLAARLKVGDQMTEFDMKGESGKVYNLEAIKGKKVIFAFMQAACSACQGEVNMLNGLAKEAKNVLILPVSVDMGGLKALQQYKKDYSITLDFLSDPEFKFPRVFGFSYTPATALIGADGKVAALLGGYEAETEAKIREFLK